MPHSRFSFVNAAPNDPILGLTEEYKKDKNLSKVNLGVGVYYDNEGKIPILSSVSESLKLLYKKTQEKNYLPIDGLPEFKKNVSNLIFGDNCSSLNIATFQSLGGTGALKIGADFLKSIFPENEVYISDPSWANHNGIFSGSGFKVNKYPYYSASANKLDFENMCSFLNNLRDNSIIVLHTCCHNPTGIDISHDQWVKLADIFEDRRLIPFFDMAYQGFGSDLETDAFPIRLFSDRELSLLVANSFSKSMSLYGERIGALNILCKNLQEKNNIESQVKTFIRANYSNPPITGGLIVNTILNSIELKKMWISELAKMNSRIKSIRQTFTEKLNFKTDQNFDFLNTQAGMFSFSGITEEKVNLLKNDYSIYMIKNGRICVAAINSNNIEYISDSIAAIIS
jgi:aromatic-amino-acid transaminase